MVSPQIADVLPQGELAVDELTVDRLEAVVLGHQTAGAEAELLEILRRPPVAHHAVTVGFGPLIIKTVAHLVANDPADGSVVDRIIRRHVEEGGCKMAAGKTISLLLGL